MNSTLKFAGLLSLAAALAVLFAGECRASIIASSSELLSVGKAEVGLAGTDAPDTEDEPIVFAQLAGGSGCGTTPSDSIGGSRRGGSMHLTTGCFLLEALLRENLPLSANPRLPSGSPDDLLRPPRLSRSVFRCLLFPE